MPRFERGQAKYEIHQYGNAVGVREWLDDEHRLMGYCMFEDAATAWAEMERLLREKSAEGFRPKDDAAKKLSASLKLEGPKKKAPPALPLRQDIYVYNEATGFAIGSLKLAGKGMEDGDRKWTKAVNDGLLMPISLYQDDPFCIRVVAGDKLSAQELEEWVGRVDSRLKLADGKMCISGGSEWVYEGYAKADIQDDNFVRLVDLPPGNYRATLYAHLSGVNGEACLHALAGGPGQAEPLGQWFRRSRPGERFPEWLVYRCVAYPDKDPGHEKEWQNTPLPDSATMPEFVDFLLHLEPAEAPEKPAKAKTTSGWFSDSENARKPERCPAGLVAKDVIGHDKRVKGKWFYPSEVFPLVEGRELRPVKGGEVAVPLDRLGDVIRIARFCHQHARPELRASLAPGAPFALDGKWPENFLAIRDGDVVRFGISQDLHPAKLMEAAMEPLKKLPEGCVLELATTVFGHSSSQTDRPFGTHRYRGKIANGAWHIEQTYPQVDAESLRAALEISAEARECKGFKLRSGDEASKIQQWCKANLGSMISDNPPEHEGEFIRLKKPDAGDHFRVGGAVLAVRYGGAWPVFELAAEPAKPKRVRPTQGESVMETPSGRKYFLTDARALGPAVNEAIDRIEKELTALGFRYAADVFCNVWINVAVRAYASREGDTWASILCAAPDVARIELSTRFEKEKASLVTSSDPRQTGDDLAKLSFKQGFELKTVEELLTKHKARLAKLATEYGPPIPIEPTARSIAESIEAALAKQFGG